MWVVGPRLYWGLCEFSEVSILSAVTVLYVRCKRWRFCAVRLAPWVFCLVTVTHHCGGFVKRMSSKLDGVLSSSAHMCSFKKSPHLSWCPQDWPLSSSPLCNQVTLKYAISWLVAGGPHSESTEIPKTPKWVGCLFTVGIFGAEKEHLWPWSYIRINSKLWC